MNTLTRSKEWEQDRREAFNFQIFFQETNPSIWRNLGKKYFSYDLHNNKENIIISHESLYDHIPFRSSNAKNNIRFEPYLLSARLKEIANYCWPHGNTKAFFFFRRQADWLPSCYAHVCYRLKNPSQHDFNKRVKNILDDNIHASHVIDYYLLYEQLSIALGDENVLALPYETIMEETTWNSLREFTGIYGLGKDVDFKQKNINVKRYPGESDWRISNKAKWIPGRSALLKALPIIRRLISKNQRQKVIKQIYRIIGKGDMRIAMPEKIDAEVSKVYKKSNQKLAKLINIDLSSYNYY